MRSPSSSPSPENVESLDLSPVFAAFPQLSAPSARRLQIGLINDSFSVQDQGQEYILQRINPTFSIGIQENIQAVTRHLKQKGMQTLELMLTKDGGTYTTLENGEHYRLMTRVPGISFDTVDSPTQAKYAAAYIACFHNALLDLEHEFLPTGIRLHDTPYHIAHLNEALDKQELHPYADEVRDMAEQIESVVSSWEDLSGLPLRIGHGDLKFNNLLFRGESPEERIQVEALIDLDTLSPLPLYQEMGDAWRSWCNPNGESEGEVKLDLDIFKASARGYLDAVSFEIKPDERNSLALGIERISLELAARFAADTLEESYFAWDAKRFQRAAEHNLRRAQRQLELHRQAVDTREQRIRFLSG
ncbi:MAG: aminoglycoside phosphotransferase family protein [Deltaproteobacteria bacterium]|nr:aminoglycoside phosphotransferase family protein [Deltaproteobacteria bacterium]